MDTTAVDELRKIKPGDAIRPDHGSSGVMLLRAAIMELDARITVIEEYLGTNRQSQ